MVELESEITWEMTLVFTEFGDFFAIFGLLVGRGGKSALESIGLEFGDLVEDNFFRFRPGPFTENFCWVVVYS